MVSPGGVGFDISCGVRLLASGLDQRDLAGCLPALMDTLAARIPRGLGRGAVWRLGSQPSPNRRRREGRLRRWASPSLPPSSGPRGGGLLRHHAAGRPPGPSVHDGTRAASEARRYSPRGPSIGYGFEVWIVGSPLTTHTSGLIAGTNERSPPGSRVAGTESPFGWWMM